MEPNYYSRTDRRLAVVLWIVGPPWIFGALILGVESSRTYFIRDYSGDDIISGVLEAVLVALVVTVFGVLSFRKHRERLSWIQFSLSVIPAVILVSSLIYIDNFLAIL